jgi:hypothetical protein
MPTNRIPVLRPVRRQITAAAVAAYRAHDFKALHHALGLRIWERSPLPRSVTPLGVDQGRGPGGDYPFDTVSWDQAQELQRALEAAVAEIEAAEAAEPREPPRSDPL